VDSNEIWNAVLCELKAEVKPAIFERWFVPAKAKTASGKSLTIEVPNIFYKNWIHEHYQALIEKRLLDHFGKPAQLVIDVCDEQGRNGRSSDIKKPPRRRTGPNGSAYRRQGANGSLLNPKYTFDNFVEGSSNRFARAGCMAVAEAPARAYNPLFIYGGVGLGKTHLMQAIAQHILIKNKSKLNVYYISSEKFTNHMITSIEKRKMEAFRCCYRNTNCLLIDDIQFLSGKEQTQEEFFHTFNTLFEYNSQIVVSCDRPPRELDKMEERLTSRFQWGLVVDLQPPDFETRVAILHKRVAILNREHQNGKMVLPDELAFYLARKVKSNIRQLEGALLKIAAYATMLKVPLTISLAEKVLADCISEEEIQSISLEEIQKKVAEFFDIRVADMKSSRKPKNIAQPRQIAMYLAREHTDLSLQEIGEGFGGKDHSTIIYGHKIIKKKMASDPRLRQSIQKLMKTLNL